MALSTTGDTVREGRRPVSAGAPLRDEDRPGTPAGRWKVFGLAFVLALVPMLLWTLASPISSVPDEPSHFVRAAAVVRGQFLTPPWSEVPQQNSAVVPRYIAYTSAMTCFAYHPTESAGCQRLLKGDPNTPTTTGTTAQTNSPVFYAIVGLPSLVLSGKVALYAMRAMNAGLCALLIGLAFMSLSQLRRRRWALLGALVAITPMTLYLGGSVNPNAVEATSALCLFATLCLVFSRYSTRALLAERVGIVVFATILLTGTRSISLLWVLLALGAALLLGSPGIIRRLFRRPVIWAGAASAAIVCILELVWFRTPAGTAPTPPLSGVGTPWIDAFAYMLMNTFDFGLGWIGYFGWVDTPAPAITLIAWIVPVALLLVAVASIVRGRRLWAVVLLFAALVLTPAFSQAAVIGQLGYIWQGRYTLAVFAMLLAACGVALDAVSRRAPGPVPARAAAILVGLLGLGQVGAFFFVLRRYVTGTAAPLSYMVTHVGWQPPLRWETLMIAYLIVSVIVCAVIIRRVLWWRAERLAAPVLLPAS